MLVEYRTEEDPSTDEFMREICSNVYQLNRAIWLDIISDKRSSMARPIDLFMLLGKSIFLLRIHWPVTHIIKYGYERTIFMEYIFIYIDLGMTRCSLVTEVTIFFVQIQFQETYDERMKFTLYTSCGA